MCCLYSCKQRAKISLYGYFYINLFGRKMASDKVTYWADLSDYDYETALAMQKTKRYLYVGFMAHQCIEKSIKAFYAKHHTTPPPYSHSLSYLAAKANLTVILSEEQKDFIDLLEPLNIETRYPSHKEKLLKSLTKERCANILEQTKLLQQWIKKML